MDAFIVERLGNRLNTLLKGKRLTQAFTTSLIDLFLVFEDVPVKVSFFEGAAFFQFPELEKLQKKNRLPIYKSALGATVSQVVTYPYDRQFKLVLEHGEELSFYLFGRFSQITHYQNRHWQETFPVKSSRVEYSTEKTGLQDNLELENLKFLPQSIRTKLNESGYQNLDYDAKQSIIEDCRGDLLRSNLYINKGKKYTLDYGQGEENIASFREVDNALDQFSRLYIAHQVYKQIKGQHLSLLQRELKSLQQKRKSADKRISQLNKASSYKEKADLLMANLWQIEKGKKEVLLTSFDGEKEVQIKLKPILSPQDNASIYYKKSKNEGKQRQYAQKYLNEITLKLEQKEKEIDEYEKTDSLKDLRKQASAKQVNKTSRVPYQKREVDGFEIRIGKGAKDNDELLRSHTTKTDLWLHAKDVSGSHVIIRNPATKQIPNSTLEKVAAIAAYYSKSKNETLAAVMYTDRKFVRKPKGATPGLVKVDRHETVLVEPADLHK